MVFAPSRPSHRSSLLSKVSPSPLRASSPLRAASSSSSSPKYVGYWNSLSNQRQFFDQQAAAALSVRIANDWYRIRVEDVYEEGGKGLLNGHYGGSLLSALQTVYPEYNWKLWRYEQILSISLLYFIIETLWISSGS